MSRLALTALAASALAAGPAAAVPFVVASPSGGASTAAGQSFVPSVGATPDPGSAGSDTVFLQSFAFTSGGSGDGASDTRLAILPGAFFDFSGGATTADALGVSSNAVDTAGASFGDALVFDFGGLALSYTDDAPYSAVFVTDDGAGNLTPSAASVTFVVFDGADPVLNLGGAGNFDVVALFPDGNGDGFFEGAGDAQDLGFTATFDSVPEPASLALVGLGGLLIAGRRR